MNSPPQQYQQYPSSQKNQVEINSQPIQLPSKIHYHSRQNSPTNLTNFLGLSSKAEQFNTNNLYEYTDSNYNPLQDSPFINFSQLEPTPSSGQKSIMKVNSKILDPVYKGQQYELKLDSDKQILGATQLQNTIKPNIFVTQEYLENDKLAPTKKEIDISGFQIKSQQISPNSVNQNQQSQYSNNQYFTSADKNDKQQQKSEPDERRVLDFNDGLNSTGKKITQIRSPALTQKTKPQLGFYQSNFKTPQTEQSEQKLIQGSSVEKNTTPANKTFEDTPEIIKISKNVLQPQFPSSYSYSSLNNPASIKIKKPSPKNKQASHSIFLPSQKQQQNNESQISQFESINLNQPRGNNMNSNIKKISYENKNQNGSRYMSEKQSANFLQIDQIENDHIDKYSQPSIQNSLQNMSISQIQSQYQSASSQKQQKYQQENKYSSLYKVKPSSNNFNSEYKTNEPLIHKEHSQNNFYQLKKTKDPYNNYYDSRPIIPSSDLNNLSDISEYVSKQTPSKTAAYHSAINQNLNQSGIKKMQEFPQKKRELLEQQRQLLQKEREILEREKELIEQEEDIFYEISQGQLTQMSPARSSNNPLNMATTPKDKKLDLQNYISTQPYQSNFYLDDKNYPQQQYESAKSSKKSQQNSQALNGTDKIYEKTIRDSQNINSQYKLGFMNNSQQAPEDQKQTLNKTEQTNNISADKKANPFYYTLNSLHASKNSQPQHFQNIDQSQQQQAIQISQEQNFQRKKSDLEQSFHTNMNAQEEKNIKDIINYFKSDQEKTKKSSHNDKQERPNNINNIYSNKIILLPLPMKKELSQKNKQPQITNQSPPEKTEETLILELMTPQKNNEQKEIIANNKNLPQPFQIDTNNPNAYLVKKQKIFSPNSQKYNRSLTPQTYFLSKNNQNIKISPNHHEFGIQVDENSFYDRASFINKNSPKSDMNTKKTMTVSDIKSNPISAIDRASTIQGQSNFSSPIMKFQYHNDASTNDFVDSNQPINLSSYIISNKQSIQKGEPQTNDRYRSVSQIQPQNNLQSSIEYVYGNKNANKKQKSDLLCFGCGDTQASTENNIIIESDQIHQQINNQHQEPAQQKQTTQFHTFQTQPQEIIYPLSKSYQPTQNNHLNKIQDQYVPEQTIQSAQISFKTQEDQKANPPLLTQLTFNQDSIRSPYFRDEREEQVKRANISPQKIFYQRPNASRSPIQYSVEKISYDPTDYKNNNNQSNGFHRSHINNTSFHPTQNLANNNINSNSNLNGQAKIQIEQLENASSFFNPSSNNSFLSNIPKPIQQKNNETLDFSYINCNQNTSGVFHLDSQELFCDKCLEFITQSRFQTHYNICSEMSQFKFLDKKKQMELINQKILKIAYLVKRKNSCASPIKGKQLNQSPNQRILANPNSSQLQQQKENNDQTKLKNYCNYLNECLCDLSHKTITQQDFMQGKEDLQLIIQRIKSIKDNHNMYYYGEIASDIIAIKNNLLMQNPI